MQENINYFSPLFLLERNSKLKPIDFTKIGIVNSVGNFGLIAVSKRKSIKDYLAKNNIHIKFKTINCDKLLKSLVAIAIKNDSKYNDNMLKLFIKEIEK